MVLQNNGKLEIIDKCCYFCVTRSSKRICLYVYLKLSVHSIWSERLTQVYKGTHSRGRGYIDLEWGYLEQLFLKSFK